MTILLILLKICGEQQQQKRNQLKNNL